MKDLKTKCPACGASSWRTLETRQRPTTWRRRRVCGGCNRVFNTRETFDSGCAIPLARFLGGHIATNAVPNVELPTGSENPPDTGS